MEYKENNNKLKDELIERLKKEKEKDKFKILEIINFLMNFYSNVHGYFDDNNTQDEYIKNNIEIFNQLVDLFNETSFELSKDETLTNEQKQRLDYYQQKFNLLTEEFASLNFDKYNIDKSSLCFNNSKEYYQQQIKNLINYKLYLSSEQINALEELLKEENANFNMPTSFGKSLLIRLCAIIRSSQGLRTIICVSTNALMNEYRNDLNLLNKNLLISSNPLITNNAYIYVVTQERLLDFDWKPSDFLIVDESYELNNYDKRSAIANLNINKAINEGTKIKLFQPNFIDDFKYEFINWNNNAPLRTYTNNKNLCSRKIQIKTNDIEKIIVDIIVDISIKSIQHEEKLIIYTYKKNHLEYATLIKDKYIERNIPLKINNEIKEKVWYDILKELYTDDYLPFEFLNYGIIINNGQTPKLFRFITEKIVRNNKLLNVILCNSTLAKGVNLKADKLIINSKNGISPNCPNGLDKFEIKNVLGRIGRISNTFLSKYGTVYVILNNEKDAREIAKINSMQSVKYEYKPDEENDESKRIKEEKDNIINAKFEPHLYVLNNKFENENQLEEHINKNKEKIISFFNINNCSDSFEKYKIRNNYYDFIIDLFGGEKDFVLEFAPNNSYYKRLETKMDKGKFAEIINNVIKGTIKKQMFAIIFENYPISRVVKDKIKFYQDNGYQYDCKYNRFIKNENEDTISFNEFRNNKDKYRKFYTKQVNLFLKETERFKEGYYSIIQSFIIKYLNQKENLKIDLTDPLDEIIDKYSFPSDFKDVLRLYEIKTLKDFEDNDFFKKLIDELNPKSDENKANKEDNDNNTNQ